MYYIREVASGWAVYGPPHEQYTPTWDSQYGEGSLIASGLTKHHAEVVAEALAVDAQVLGEAHSEAMCISCGDHISAHVHDVADEKNQGRCLAQPCLCTVSPQQLEYFEEVSK